MIRRSTLVLLTCLGVLSVPAIQTKSAAQTLVAQSAPSAVDSFKGLGVGSRGEPVRQLQRRLTEIDYYSGPIDGLYGLETQRAIVALQRASSLDDNGTLNEATWKALELSAQVSPDGGVGDAVIAPPIDSEVNTELPSVGEIAPVIEPESTGGIKPAVAIGLGLLGLLGSFGVGFLIANRGKAKANDDGWDTIDSSAVGVDPPLAAGEGALPIAPDSAFPAAHQNAQNNSQPVNPQFVDNGSTSGPLGTQAYSQGYAQANGADLGRSMGGQMGAQSGTTGPMSQVDVIEGLMGELHNPDPAKRRKAIWELGQRGNSIAVQPLVDAMPNADSKEKSLLLAALSEIGIRSLRPMNRAMAIAFQDPNPEVRKNAIRDLSRVYDLVVQISHMLGHAVEDEDAEVRQTATWALEKLNQTRKVQDVDTNMRSFSGGSNATPIDLLSSEASIRRSQEMR